MTTDGTPLSQLEVRQQLDGSLAPRGQHRDAPTAEEIMRALEAEQDAAAAATNNGSRPSGETAPPAHWLRKPSTQRGRRGRRLHAARYWVLAGIVSAGVAATVVVQLASGAGTTAPRQPSRAVAAGARALANGLIAAATARFLAVEHAAHGTFSPPRPRSTHTTRTRRLHPRRTPLQTSTRPPRGSPSQSTSSTRGTSEAVDTTQQTSAPSSLPPSSSTSSGSTPTASQRTAPSSRSASPSKATLRSLVTGAGTCGCR
jgi:hypothetical protein